MTTDPVAKWTKALGLQWVRGGNKVTALIDGAETFRAICEAIRNTDGAGFIYILAWWLDVDLPLVSTDIASTLRALLTAAASRQVKVRAMVWKQAVDNETNEKAIAFINSLKTGQAVLDNKTWSLFASHHQKVIVVKTGQGLVGFCGGLDINADRVIGGVPAGSPGAPLHDVHCKIEGPGAYDLLAVFKQRWFGYGDPALDQHIGEAAKVPPNQGDQYVRIARTFNYVGKTESCQASRSVRATIMNAIANANRFIYIEDQYMVNVEAAQLLAQKIPDLQHVTILVTHPSISDYPEIGERQIRFFNEIMKAPGAESKVGVYVRTSKFKPPLGPHAYIHAKTWVVDDQLAIIGSANLDVRGWSGDNQANACIFDGPASDKKPSFAQRYRMRLWSEHLRVAESVVVDGIASVGLWKDRKKAPNADVAPWGQALEGAPRLPMGTTILGGVLGRDTLHQYSDISADQLKVCTLDTPSAPGDRPDLGIW